jgi:hypothetical protein
LYETQVVKISLEELTMSRRFWANTAVATIVLASISAGELFAQGTRGGTTTGGTGGFGGAGTGTTRGTTGTTGFGGQTGGLGTTQGLAAGIGGLGATNVNQQLQQQTRNLQTLLNQNRNTQLTQQVTIQNQVPVRVQFPTLSARPSTIAAAAPVQAKLSRVMSNRGYGSALAMWEGDVLVLTGTVENEAVRRQIEGVALLEPGVRTVRNETVVGPVSQ